MMIFNESAIYEVATIDYTDEERAKEKERYEAELLEEETKLDEVKCQIRKNLIKRTFKRTYMIYGNNVEREFIEYSVKVNLQGPYGPIRELDCVPDGHFETEKEEEEAAVNILAGQFWVFQGSVAYFKGWRDAL